MKVVVIDYGSGNLQSVVNALEALNEKCEIIISDKKEDLRKANHIILPGVGSFGDCMDGLKARDGLIEELRQQVLKEQKPFLGICVGMQILASIGVENGEYKGLGLIDGKVVKIDFSQIQNPQQDFSSFKIPQMGWNALQIKDPHPILKNVENGAHVYFANSYHFLTQNQNNVVAYVDYGIRINAVVAKKNVVGVQFHPEKSGEVGLQILRNFLQWRF